MNLTSCDNCGVVLDKDKIIFPAVYGYGTQEVIPGNAEWDGEEYIAKVDCPVCGEKILDR